MSWYNEAIFYHIYPLGLTGAPKQNEYTEPVHRLNTLLPWIDHIKEIGCTALYIGPLFESVGHGYETTDYKKLDSRLGTNEDLTAFVKACHDKKIKVIFDGVFNHTGRDFFAFKDIQQNRENSRYLNWYCNVNFWGNNEYNDGFSYDNWGGYNLLVKLNQRNPEVQDYICDVIRYWVSEFDVDGIRLDAADVLDFDFMRALRHTAEEVKPDFWLMGEVIHGDYSRWVNGETLHSVTNYALHKALYSGHNDHNYFEIAHTVKYLQNMGNLDLYNFVDNHDVERIYTKLSNKAHFTPVHILLYTLPGIPSIYYGSEFGIEGRKERSSDDSLRPALNITDYKDAVTSNPCTASGDTLKVGEAYWFSLDGASFAWDYGNGNRDDSKRQTFYTMDFELKGKHLIATDTEENLSNDELSLSIGAGGGFPNRIIKPKKAGTLTITGTIYRNGNFFRDFKKSYKVEGNTPSPTPVNKPTKPSQPATTTSTKKPTQPTVSVKTTKLKSAKNVKGKKLVVKWAKNTAGNGYQIQYSTSKKFAKGNKTKTISKNKTTSYTIKKLKKKKTYYVRIRTYKKVSGKTYYSGWSSVKKVKIKK